VNPLAPTPTAFDLRFRLFGTPVRIHPTFWLIGALLGWQLAAGSLERLAIFVLALCFATLVHEMGHALMVRVFREPAHIILFAFGGVALFSGERLRGWHRLLIVLAGPGAGFLLFGLLWGAHHGFEALMTHNPQALSPETKAIIRRIFRTDFIVFTMLIALIYNIFNMLPIYPLDGGQIVRELALGVSPSRGVQISLGLSFLVAASIAVYSAIKMQRPELPYPPLDPMFSAIFIGLMALENFMMLQQTRREARRWDDDRSW
jgi:Zn-dependent protease